METKKVLHMTFLDVAGDAKTLRVPDPREDLTAAEVKAAMQKICDTAIFGATAVSVKGAKVVETNTSELDITIS